MSLASDRAKANAVGKPTLYKRIRLDIETRILTGEWPPGHRIPFEHQLMARYRCSRMTVNKALSELAQADLIERRRRAGTFVRRPQHMSAVLKIFSSSSLMPGLMVARSTARDIPARNIPK